MQKARFNGSFLEDTVGRMNNFVQDAKSREWASDWPTLSHMTISEMLTPPRPHVMLLLKENQGEWISCGWTLWMFPGVFFPQPKTTVDSLWSPSPVVCHTIKASFWVFVYWLPKYKHSKVCTIRPYHYFYQTAGGGYWQDSVHHVLPNGYELFQGVHQILYPNPYLVVLKKIK